MLYLMMMVVVVADVVLYDGKRQLATSTTHDHRLYYHLGYRPSK